MPVTVVIKATGEMFRGKFADIHTAKVVLYAEILPDGKGGFRGCGKKSAFPAEDVEVLAHRRDIEVTDRRSSPLVGVHPVLPASRR